MKQIYSFQTGLLKSWFATFLLLGVLSQANAQISGIVFRDYDLNGIRSDTLPIETGVTGITIFAFVDLSKAPVTTTTDATGKYSFSSSEVPAGRPVRIEFSNLPTGDQEGPYGTNSGTSVQFIKAPATDVNLGINYPSGYCQRTDLRIVMPCYVNEDALITVVESRYPMQSKPQKLMP
ncbi:SdrD B-like domain-containing protein [Spirosoma soli]|uniref:SdrD B-like domain-containing protein n=1 Tax=Spirosoma soli TaxID=1770529 RepID=A0ABW5MAN5_9BACT